MCTRCGPRWRLILSFSFFAAVGAGAVLVFEIPPAVVAGLPLRFTLSVCLFFAGIGVAADSLRWLAPRARALLRGFSDKTPAGVVVARGRAIALRPLVAPIS